MKVEAGQEVRGCVHFARHMSNGEVKLKDKIACIPEGRGNDFCLKETCHGFIVSEDDNRFGLIPKNVAILHESEVDGQKFFRVDRHFDL